jgi:glycosyltransferase involved in cell wall biosynthesis
MINNKIIHLITTLERGGAEKQLLILAEEQVSQNLDVEVIYLKGKPDLKKEFEQLGVKVSEFVANKKFINQVKILKKYFRDYSGLVNTHLPRAEIIAFLTVNKKRYVISRHNHEQFWPLAPKLVSALLSRIVVSRAVGGIAISRTLKEYLIQNREISKKFPIQVIYYGSSRKLGYDPDQTSHKAQIFTQTNDSFKVGIISRLVPGKDYPTLFKAIQRVLEKYKKIDLYIVGDGNQKEELFLLAKTLGIDKNVFWLGKIDGVSKFLSELDLFVFTSKGEGFGLVLLEAMLASKPILAANNSAIPEVLGKSYYGLFETSNYNELASKISKVIESSDYSKALIDSYQPQIELFNSNLMAKLVKQTYEIYGF